MADTDILAVPATATIAPTDSMVLARAGLPVRTINPLPGIDAAGNVGVGTATPFNFNGKNLEVSDSFVARLHLVNTAPAGRRWWMDSQNGGLLTVTDGTASATRLAFDLNGNVGIGTTAPAAALHVVKPNAAAMVVQSTTAGATDTQISIQTPNRIWNVGQNIGGFTGPGTFNIFDVTGGALALTFDTNRNLLVGTNTSSSHFIGKSVAQGGLVLEVANYGTPGSAFYSVSGSYGSSTGSALRVGFNSTTNRSINAGGTINASGADYAEYLKKALAYLEVAFLKGQVLGIDPDGNLTCRWSEAHSFVIKSYNPSYVGGDTWASHLKLPAEPVFTAPVYTGPAEPAEIAPWQGARPEPTELPAQPPVAGPAEPVMPVRQAGEDNDAWTLRLIGYANERTQWEAAYAMGQMAVARYPELVREIQEADATALASYEAAVAADRAAIVEHNKALSKYLAAQRAYDAAFDVARAEHEAAMATFAADLAAFELAMEKARQTVDRIAFSGQVPVIVTGDCAPGTNADPVYLVAFEAHDDAIECRALPWSQIIADPTRLLETRVVGKVWAIRDVQLDPADTSPAPEMVRRAWANVLHR